MAITRTYSLRRVLVLLENPSDTMQLIYTDTFDDPNDDQLPVVTKRTVDIPRYDSEGNSTDLTGYEQVVQDIAAAVWTDSTGNDGE